MKEELRAAVDDMLREEIAVSLLKASKKRVFNQAKESVDRFLKTQEFRDIVRLAIKDLIKDYLFDDADWIPWRKIEERVARQMLAGVK